MEREKESERASVEGVLFSEDFESGKLPVRSGGDGWSSVTIVEGGAGGGKYAAQGTVRQEGFNPEYWRLSLSVDDGLRLSLDIYFDKQPTAVNVRTFARDAYENFGFDPQNLEPVQDRHHFNMKRNLYWNRTVAVAYLREVASRRDGQAAEALREAAASYESVLTQLEQLSCTGPAGESFASRLALTGHFSCVNCQQSNARLLLRYGHVPAEALRSYPRAPTLLALPGYHLPSALPQYLQQPPAYGLRVSGPAETLASSSQRAIFSSYAWRS